MGRRTWVKLYVSTIFGSTSRELDPAERWVWIGFLALAGDSQWDGIIKATDTIGYSDDQLSDLLAVPASLLKSAKLKMVKVGKIEVSEKGIISIINWNKYQSEYDRQKKFRSKKLQDEVTVEGYAPEREREEEEDKDKEEEKEKAVSINDPILAEFETGFWKAYPLKVNKQDALAAYRALRKKTDEPKIAKAFFGYIDFLKHQRVDKKFKQNTMYPATFLRKERWAEYIDFVYKPRL